MRRFKYLIYASPALFFAVFAACGDPLTTAEQTQTAQPAAAADTPTSEVTPGETSISPPQTEATPAPVTPTSAASSGRTDCPSDWAAYNDPEGHFSVCYPGWLLATAREGAFGAQTIRVPDDASAMPRVSASVALARSAAFPEPIGESCSTIEGLPGKTSGEPVELLIDGNTAVGCHFVGEPSNPAGPLESLQVSLGLGNSGPSTYLHLTFNWRTTSSGAKDLIDQMISLLHVAP